LFSFLFRLLVQGRDINLDIKRVVGYRNFCNKLWQGTRFLLGCFGDFLPTPGMAAALLSSAAAPRDAWILHKLNDAVGEVTKCYELYEFGKGVQVLDAFFRGRLCDVYLELIKPSVNKCVLKGPTQARRGGRRGRGGSIYPPLKK
jgi:valyl-tRNA synthetase